MKTYSSYGTDIIRVINNNLADNQTWGFELINDSIRYLVTKYYFNERTYTVPGGTIASTQFYNLPPQVKRVINVTITIGSVRWQPKECPSRQYWDALNVITFTQDFPAFFFVYNGQIGIFPTPASGGNTITINYKTRIEDLSMVDVTDVSSLQTMTATSGSTALLASGTTNTFLNWMGSGVAYIRMGHSTTNSANGDNQWYQLSSVTSGTQATLMNVYTGANVAGGTFTIGHVSILPEDYQDLPLYRLGAVYYTTRFPDPSKAQLYQSLWDKGVAALDEEFGAKTTNVQLTDTEAPIVNPNLFVRSVG